jgi:hypothetical protein
MKTHHRRGTCIWLLIGPLAAPAAATVWTVDDDLIDFPSADFTSIQDAIDATSDGDEVLVYPGAYGGIRIINREIMLRSTGGAAVTAIDKSDRIEGIWAVHTTSSPATVDGFTVRNFQTGIRSWFGHPIFRDCIIVENDLGVECDRETTAEFHNCTISDNSLYGGIRCVDGSQPLIQGCVISNNHLHTGEVGGGLYSCVDFWDGCSDDQHGNLPTVQSTTLCGNTPVQVYGPWTNAGDVCIAFECADSDSDGQIDECGQVADGVHEVPGEFSSIAAAIAVAGGGDVVLVGPGVWTSTGDAVVDPRGKPITIRASHGPEETFLDGETVRRVVVCNSGEQPETILEGFTIRRGLGTGLWRNGGGVQCMGGSPTLTQCHIIDNVSEVSGGGVAIAQSNAVLDHCRIAENTASGSAGILSTDSHLTVASCVIENNTAAAGGGLSGGLYTFGSDVGGEGQFLASLTMTDTVIRKNTSGDYGPYIDAGGLLLFQSKVMMTGCEITENNTLSSDAKSAFTCVGSDATLVGCLISDNSSEVSRGAGILIFHEGIGGPPPGPSNLVLVDCFIGDNDPLQMPSPAETGSAVFAEHDEVVSLSGTTVCGAGPDPIWVWGGTYGDDGTNCVAPFCGDADSDGTLDMCEEDDGDGVFHVPSEYERIQAAVFVAEDGDLILVDPGTYTGIGQSVVGIAGKSLTLQSVVPHGAILDGEQTRPVVSCWSEIGGTVIADFEIRGGGMRTAGSGSGGGVGASGDVTITGCHIHDCQSSHGGGILAHAAGNEAPLIDHCVIEFCEAAYGGGVKSESPYTSIGDTTVCGNQPTQIDGQWDDLGGNSIHDECAPPCPDIDGDGQVGANDILVIISYWGTNDDDADVTGDGVVGTDDLLAVISAWGLCE